MKNKNAESYCDILKYIELSFLKIYLLFLETVATVNRADGVQGRLEDNQERLVAAG